MFLDRQAFVVNVSGLITKNGEFGNTDKRDIFYTMIEFSIITIAYNNLAGLRKTADSVLTQTKNDFEWIIVDGASTDGTQEYLNEIPQRWQGAADHLQIISEPDTGIYNAMNKGIRMAHGDYLQFLNSGDCLVAADTMLQLAKQQIITDIAYGYQYDDKNGECVPEQCIDVPYITFETMRNTHIPHQSTLIRREALQRLGGYDEQYKIISDWAFVMKGLFKYDLTISRIPQYIAVYDTNGISSNADKSFQWQERADFLHREFPLFMPDYERWDRLNQNAYMKLIRLLRDIKNSLLCHRK